MSIPGLSPQLPAPLAEMAEAAAIKVARAGLEALGLEVGQVLDAKVLGTSPNGLTQLSLAGQLLSVKLSLPVPAGTQLQLKVQAGGPQGPPVLVAQALPQQPAAAPPPLPAPTIQLPLPQTMTPMAPSGTPFVAAPMAQPGAPPPAPVGMQALASAAPSSQAGPLPAVAAAPQPQAPSTPVVPPMVGMEQPALRPTASTGTTPPSHPSSGSSSPSAPQPIPVASPLAFSSRAPASVAVPQALATSSPPPAAAPAQSLGSALVQTLPQSATLPSAPGSTAIASPPTSGSTAPTPALTAGPPAAPSAPPAAPAQIQQGVPLPNAQSPTGPAPSVNLASAAAPGPIAASSQTAAPAAPPSVLPAPATAMPIPMRAAAPPPPAPPPPAGSAAQANLSQATQAAARQDSMAPLLQNLSMLQGRLGELPRPVSEAALRLLAGRINLDRGVPTADGLKQAVLRSGIFLEALAKPGAPTLPPQTDAKASLLQLRGALAAWLGEETAPVAPATRRPQPPARGAQPRGLRSEPPTLPETASAKEAGRTLLGQTEAAISRVRLLQLASLPQDNSRAVNTGPAAPAEWRLEIPLLLGHELAMAQLQITRDGKGRGERRERGWRMAISLNFSALGEVGAQVSLFGTSASVMIWAEDEGIAAALAEMLPELAPALTAKGLNVGSVRVRQGRPKEAQAPSGQLLDSVG